MMEDWYFEYSDDHRVWARGMSSKVALTAMQKALDPNFEVWNQHCPKDLQMQPKSA
jgi:hypothetical protein